MTNKEFKVRDKVFVSNWGKLYSDIFKYENSIKKKVFNWTYDIPDIYKTSTSFHWERVYKPRLTQKGEPFKNGDRILVSERPLYKHFKYEILEIIKHPSQDNLIYLLGSEEGCIVQIGEGGISLLSPEQYKMKEFNSFIEGNLKKWSLQDDLKNVPDEIITIYYDSDGRALFGSDVLQSSIIYKVLDGKFTKDGIPICLGTSCLYDGGEEAKKSNNFITWVELKKLCKNQKFQG